MIRSAKTSCTEDIVDCGVELEDSGDRWIDTDKAKALRFYAQAQAAYRTAIASDNGSDSTRDAVYNLARVQYLVYDRLVRHGELSCDVSPELAAQFSQDILEVAQTHKTALERTPNSPDLLFNYSVVLLDVSEQIDSLPHVVEAIRVLDELIKSQYQELDRVVSCLQSPTNEAPSGSNNATPGQIVESHVARLNCLIRALELDPARHSSLHETGLSDVASIASLHQLMDTSDLFYEVDEAARTSTLIVIAQFHTAFCNSKNVQDVCQIWGASAASTDKNADMLLAQADALADLPDRWQLPLEASWQALGMVQKLLGQVLADFPALDAAKRRRVLIARGDMDWRRAEMSNLPAAVKNKPVLVKNAKTYYKAAYDLQSLQEEVLLKKRLRNEALVKLQLLDGAPRDSLVSSLPNTDKVIEEVSSFYT